MVRVIEPTTGWLSLNLRELWRYRELLQLLVWRDTVVRYKQSVVGIGWTIIQPITAMVIFSAVFGRLADLPFDGIPCHIFTVVAILPWSHFAGYLSVTSSSLVGGAHLVGKLHFPRLILPLSNLSLGRGWNATGLHVLDLHGRGEGRLIACTNGYIRAINPRCSAFCPGAAR